MSETAVCWGGAHELCSGRVCTNPSDGWHNAKYEPCTCECHKPQPIDEGEDDA